MYITLCKRRQVEKISVLIVASVCLLSCFSPIFQVEAQASGSESVRIMPLGDSITQGDTKFPSGTPDLDPPGYRKRLYTDLFNAGYFVDFVGSKRAGSSAFPPVFDIDHEGWSGSIASTLNPMLSNLLSASNPDIVLYHIGTNDLYTNNVAKAASDANESLRIIYAFNPRITVLLARIILTTNSVQNSRTQAYNLLLDQCAGYWRARGYSIFVVNMENVLRPSLYPLGDLVDSVHPAQSGYVKMATAWFNALINILPSPNLASFTISPTPPYVNVALSFDASSSYSPITPIVSYQWDFGDGFTTISTSPLMTHIYTTSGPYSVKLTITDSFGLTKRIEKTIIVLQDSLPPITEHNYSSTWQASDFTISLTATDNGFGVAQIYYRTNSGPTQTVSINGQPHITNEGANNTLEYWSIDVVGNEELPHKMLTSIGLDKTPPSGSIQVNYGSAYTNMTRVNLQLTATDIGSGISQMRISNDNSSWSTWEPFATSKAWNLTAGQGSKNVYVEYKDFANLTMTTYMIITLDITKPIAYAGWNQSVTMGNSVTFKGTESSDNTGIAAYIWDFGDGENGTGERTIHNYQRIGTYTGKLTVVDLAGNAATNEFTISIREVISELPSSFLMFITLIPILTGIVLMKKRALKNQV